MDILERQRHSKKIEEEKRHQKELRAKELYDELQVKVQAIRSKNLPAEKWSSAELNTMIQWHKRPDDAAMPSKKAEKLARYYDICGRGNPVAPTVLAATLPPAPEPDLAITDADCLCLPLQLKPCSKFDKGFDETLVRFLLHCFFMHDRSSDIELLKKRDFFVVKIY
jgi:hypothetical protein